LNDLELDNPSAPDIDHVEDARRSFSSMGPTAIDPNDSLRLHLLAISLPIFQAEMRIAGAVNI
jgi:hypothetical protein